MLGSYEDFYNDAKSYTSSVVEYSSPDLDLDWQGGYYEVDDPNTEVRDLEFRQVEGKYIFRIVRFDRSQLSAKIIFDAELNIMAEATLYAHDSVDGDDVLLNTVLVDEDVTASAHMFISIFFVTTQHGYPLDSLQIIRERRIVNKRCFYANLSTAIN